MTNIGVPNKNMSKKQGNTEYDTQNMKWKCAICGKLEKPPRLRKHGKTHMATCGKAQNGENNSGQEITIAYLQEKKTTNATATRAYTT